MSAVTDMNWADDNQALDAKARSEDFPIASIFLPRDKRAAVMALYRLARAGDDIADEPRAPVDRKRAWLEAAEATLLRGEDGPSVALAAREALLERGLALEHARDLLRAFRQDCETGRYADWSALARYYELSANPVGRFLMDLFGESRDLYVMSDRLCTGLGAITNLRDVREDLLELDRIYLPLDEMRQVGVIPADLRASRTNAAARSLFDAHLRRGEDLLNQAACEVPRVQSRPLRRHARLAIACGRRMAAKLRAGDPLSRRVKLSPLDLLRCGVTAILKP